MEEKLAFMLSPVTLLDTPLKETQAECTSQERWASQRPNDGTDYTHLPETQPNTRFHLSLTP